MGPDTPQKRTPLPTPHELPAIAARCFRGTDGDQLIVYLRALTLDRALGPNASDATLRHLEGQRHMVRHLETLVRRGTHGPLLSSDTAQDLKGPSDDPQD